MTLSRLTTLSQSANSDRATRALPVVAGVSLAVVLAMVFFLFKESWPFLTNVGPTRLLMDRVWSPSQQLYGLVPMLWATLAVTVGSALLAAPIGWGTAVLAQFYLPSKGAELLGGVLVTMAGVPSVVYGLWGLDVIVPLLAAWRPPGVSLLAGILILALMILPTIAWTVMTALAAVPRSELQAAAALGISKAGTILGVAVPSARDGIRAGVILSLGRAMGETMAVMMVCGNVVQMPWNLFEPVRPLTANIALEIAYAMGDHRAALFVSGLLLTTLASVLAVLGATQMGVVRGRVRT